MTFRSNYQRTVDTGPPRTNSGLTGLGAVGGPRGVGAGALRVIVEFLTAYDSGALEELEGRLADLDKFENKTASTRSRAIREEAAARGQITRIQKLQNALTTDQTKALQKIINLEKQRQQALRIGGNRSTDASGNPVISDERRASALKEAADLQQEILTSSRALQQVTGLTKGEVTQLVNAERNVENAKRRQAAAASAVLAADRRLNASAKERLSVEAQITAFRNRAGAAVSKLGSLALGAVGGLVGGAVVGLAFTAVQAGLEALGGVIQGILDPAKKAREELEGVASAIQSIAEREGISALEASKERLKELGAAAGELNPELLESVVITQNLIEKNKELAATLEVLKQHESLANEALKERIRLTAQAIGQSLEGPFGISDQASVQRIAAAAQGDTSIRLDAQEQEILAAVLKDVESAANGAANGAARAAAEERALANAAAFAATQNDNLARALGNARDAAMGGIQASFDTMGPTQGAQQAAAIQAQMDAQAEASARRAYGESLAANAMERSNLLLQQQLQLTNSVVNAQQYAGEQRLIAIQHNISMLQNSTSAEERQLEALNSQISAVQRLHRAQERREQQQLRAIDKNLRALQKADKIADEADQERLAALDEQIEALNEQGDAQDRVNKLLDLQYRASQVLKRQQGESIGDFLNRRAQENREILAGFSALNRESQVAKLQAERKALSDTIEAENERREAIIERVQADREALQERFEIAREERQLHMEALQAQQEQLQAVAERRQKERQMAIQAMQEEAQRVQTEIALRQNAEQRKAIIEQEAERQRQRRQQEALRRAQERDRAETESRRNAMAAQERAVADAYNRMERYSSDSYINQLNSAVRFANTLEQLNQVAGGIAGAQLARAHMQALLEGGQVSAALALPYIARLDALIQFYFRKKAAAMSQVPSTRNPVPLAEGGVFQLNNAMNNPFGANIRTGEQGPEIGVVLSNKVTQALRDARGPVPDQTFIINRSDDPWRDKHRFARVARDAISEALGG